MKWLMAFAFYFSSASAFATAGTGDFKAAITASGLAQIHSIQLKAEPSPTAFQFLLKGTDTFGVSRHVVILSQHTVGETGPKAVIQSSGVVHEKFKPLLTPQEWVRLLERQAPADSFAADDDGTLISTCNARMGS